MVTASFVEDKLDYKALFDGIQNIVHKYSDDNTEIYVAGLPVVAGWGYYYLPRIRLIFFLSIASDAVDSVLESRPAQQLVGADPDRIVLGDLGPRVHEPDGLQLRPRDAGHPFILTARDLSHGIQWQGRYYDELDRLDDKILACITTTDVMLPPGLLSILADIAGIIFISLGGIPVLKEIGLGGAVWLAGSLTMVFVFQPIFMSYLPRPTIRRTALVVQRQGRVARRTRVHAFVDWLIRIPVTPGARARRLCWRRRASSSFGESPRGSAREIGYQHAGHAALQARLQGQSGHGRDRQLHADRRGLGGAADARFCRSSSPVSRPTSCG